MRKDPNKRPPRTFNTKTGEVRFSEPAHIPPAQSELQSGSGAPERASTTQRAVFSPTSLQRHASTRVDDAVAPDEVDESISASALILTNPSSDDPGAGSETMAATAGNGKKTAAGKPKAEIETLEQFIAYAFSKKGQRVLLKPKFERVIAQNLHLDDEAQARLMALANADVQLAVPRQLLLVSREVDGHPSLRAALNGFVSSVMQRHPAFSDSGVQACLRNLPDAPPLATALRKVAEFEPLAPNDGDPIKPAELHGLRRNAVHLLSAWFATHRGLSVEELAALLLQVTWAPAARMLFDDTERIRALTDMEQAAGVGLACEKFRQRAVEANAAQDQALREGVGLRESMANLRAQLEQAEQERDALNTALAALKESAENQLTELQKQHEVERTHLRHGQEQLRGRLVRRLGDSIEMLEVGLMALRNKTPRTEVMLERAEHVIDALRAEESNLREE